MRSAVAALALLAACSTSSNNDKKDAPPQQRDAPKPIDAKIFLDAPPPDAAVRVVTVTCPTTPAATFTTTDGSFQFSPTSATIAVNAIVKFTMSSSHSVAPGHSPADTTIADPGLAVTFAATKCLQFTAAGSYGFHCFPHNFNGTITVQ